MVIFWMFSSYRKLLADLRQSQQHWMHVTTRGRRRETCNNWFQIWPLWFKVLSISQQSRYSSRVFCYFSCICTDTWSLQLIEQVSQHSYTWVLQAYLASSSYTGTVVSPSRLDKLCYMMLSMPNSRKGWHSLLFKLMSFSLGNVGSLSNW